MSLRFMDGFDHYVSADLTKKWTSLLGTPALSAGNGRRSTAALSTGGGQGAVVKTLDAQATWIVGLAFRPVALGSGGVAFMGLLDAGTLQCDLRLNADGTLAVTRNGTALTGGTSALALSAGTVVYVEWLVTIADSIAANSCQVRVNGTLWLTVATGQDTKNTANATANQLRIGAAANPGTTWYIDDLYVCDGTGAAPYNTFLGDCRVDMLLPNADGTSQQWTPSTTGTHYTLVDETAPNTTDYVSSNTVGQRETYGLQDLSTATGTIYGVQVSLAALKSDAGARSLKPLLLSGGAEALGAPAALSTSQTYAVHMQTTDPATSAAWTEAGVNSMQCGAEVA